MASAQEPPSAIALEINEHVDRALYFNAASLSYSDWKQSDATPDDVFNNVAKKNSPQAWREFCKKLTALSDEELALFDPEISSIEHSERLPCRSKLLVRLGLHWSKQSTNMDLHHALVEGRTTGIKVPTLPSAEMIVDPEKMPVLFDAGLKQKEIAFTFDDGPHPQRTERILAILKEAGVRATFFEVGQPAKAFSTRPNQVNIPREVNDQGHVVGSHSWNHPELPKLPFSIDPTVCEVMGPRGKMVRVGLENCGQGNIFKGHEQVMEATGVHVPFFRFPYGARNKKLQQYVQDLGYSTFFWNLDSLDWKIRNPLDLYQNVLHELDREEKAGRGGIILFHDIHEQTVLVLPHVLEELHKRGYTTYVFIPAQVPAKTKQPQI